MRPYMPTCLQAYMPIEDTIPVTSGPIGLAPSPNPTKGLTVLAPHSRHGDKHMEIDYCRITLGVETPLQLEPFFLQFYLNLV